MVGGGEEIVVGDWLQEIVQGMDLEAFYGILAESRREYDLRSLRQHLRKIHAAQPRHLDVAEQKIHGVVMDERKCGAAACKRPFQVEERGLLNVRLHQLYCQRLIVYYYAAYRVHVFEVSGLVVLILSRQR